jgi:threonyl-tRNA synthetase
MLWPPNLTALVAAVDNGFYYEMALPGGAAVHSTDWAPLESIVTKIVKEKQPFQRLVRSNMKTHVDRMCLGVTWQ